MDAMNKHGLRSGAWNPTYGVSRTCKCLKPRLEGSNVIPIISVQPEFVALVSDAQSNIQRATSIGVSKKVIWVFLDLGSSSRLAGILVLGQAEEDKLIRDENLDAFVGFKKRAPIGKVRRIRMISSCAALRGTTWRMAVAVTGLSGHSQYTVVVVQIRKLGG